MHQSHSDTARIRVGAGPVSFQVVPGRLIEQQDVDALVVQVNALLMPVGTLATEVHAAAGSANLNLQPFSGHDDPIVVTEARGLSNKLILHCRGPVPRRHPMYADDLAAIYRHLWRTAELHRVQALALEPLGMASRLDGVWSEAGIVIASLKNATVSPTHLQTVRFVMLDKAEASKFKAELKALT